MSPEELIALNEEIAGMARAGLPLDQGLAALAHEMGGGRLKRLTAEVAADLQAGHTLPEALERQGDRVPPYYAALLAAGVRSGRLPEVLATLTNYARSVSELRIIIVNAMFYPAVILVFSLLLFGFLSWYIAPLFATIFRDFNMTLPRLTEFVFFFTTRPLLLIVLPGVLLLLAFLWLRYSLRQSERGRRSWAQFIYGLPLFGTLVRSTRMAAFSELLAILIDHRVPLPEALRLAGQGSSEPVLAEDTARLRGDLEEGTTLAEALRKRRSVPDLITWMTGLGEQRGDLGAALHQVAGFYRRQADLRAALLRSLLPPVLLVATTGIPVGLFVFALMLPLIKLLDGLSK
jgi:type II secretory pathway component PulF